MFEPTCCIFNIAPLYKASIYKLMDQEFHCDFFLGDRVRSPMKLMKYNELKGFKYIIRFKPIFGKFYWQKGAINTVFAPYKHYIITGEPHCVSTWFILIITKLLGKKTYLWTHGWYGDETFIKRTIKKLFFRLSYKDLLYGDYARNLMIKEGFRPEKLVCIYNSLDFDTQNKVRKSLTLTSIYSDHFRNNLPVLLFLGRIQRSKKLELLIEALNMLYKKGINCNLIIIGKDIDETNLQELVSRYKLENQVWFFGPSYNEYELGELIYNADLCISPGNVGLTAMHSMVYGTPVITHNNFSNQGPEFEAIVKGETGDFFHEGSLHDLCDKIIDWISLSSDRKAFVRQKCYTMIKEKYNPHIQINILKKHII